ncbi:MAG: flagellar hook-length control protein FliK [Spirochaetaceae bacterium]|nr:flagellar hook-length control protein FliK [Spirochaetaceae bacterium]
MLHMNIQPDTIDLSLNLNQSYNVQGKNQIQGESSFSSMLEQAQEASSTEGNQTQNLEKTQVTKDLENVKESKTDEKTSMEEINSQKNDSLTTNQIDEKVFSASQLENLQNQIVSNVISDNKIPISEKNTISKDIISKIDSFVENLDLTKVSDIKELNVKNPKIDSKIIEKGDLFSIIEDLKNGTKENDEKDILNDAFPFLNFENQIGENKSTENQIVLENDLIAEIQNPEQNDGKISVIDMRTEQVAEQIANPEDSAVTKEGAKKSDFVKTVEYDSNGNATISLSLKGGNQVVDNGVVQTSNQDFSSMLSREIASSANDLVKTGSIILKDNNAGTINLILNPEELGSVKIKLEISDNQITGKILVASKEAYDAFNQNLNLLKNAFIDSGFSAGGFDLAFTGSNQQGDFGQNGNQNSSSDSGVNYKAGVYEQAVAEVVPESTTSTSTVNLVA